MGHKLTRVALFAPKNDGTLGYVEHSYRVTWFTPIANTLIGLAPLVGGCFCVWIIHQQAPAVPVFNMEEVVNLKDWRTWAAVFVLINAVPSKADFQSCSLIVLVALSFLSVAVNKVVPLTAPLFQYCLIALLLSVFCLVISLFMNHMSRKEL